MGVMPHISYSATKWEFKSVAQYAEGENKNPTKKERGGG